MQKLAEERMKKYALKSDFEGPYSHKLADNKTGLWRHERPVIEHQKCIKCGICQISCPVGAIASEEQMEINYDYCKGCGICIVECPKDAIEFVSEKTEQE